MKQSMKEIINNPESIMLFKSVNDSTFKDQNAKIQLTSTRKEYNGISCSIFTFPSDTYYYKDKMKALKQERRTFINFSEVFLASRSFSSYKKCIWIMNSTLGICIPYDMETETICSNKEKNGLYLEGIKISNSMSNLLRSMRKEVLMRIKNSIIKYYNNILEKSNNGIIIIDEISYTDTNFVDKFIIYPKILDEDGIQYIKMDNSYECISIEDYSRYLNINKDNNIYKRIYDDIENDTKYKNCIKLYGIINKINNTLHNSFIDSHPIFYHLLEFMNNILLITISENKITMDVKDFENILKSLYDCYDDKDKESNICDKEDLIFIILFYNKYFKKNLDDCNIE